MLPFVIAPSILSADLARLGEEASKMLAAGAHWIHFDVMDNHYAPNLTFGPVVCEALRNYGITAPIDVHLMVQPVDSLIRAFAKAGATYITFHPEASHHVHRSLDLIRDLGCKAGLAFNPASPLSLLPYVQDLLDMVLLMSVNPGFSGQKLIPLVLEKIKETRAWLDQIPKDIRLEVDGGINLENIELLAKSGADTFVMGSALFGSKDYAKTVQAFKDKLAQ